MNFPCFFIERVLTNILVGTFYTCYAMMRTNIKLGPGSLCQAHGPVRLMVSLLSSELFSSQRKVTINVFNLHQSLSAVYLFLKYAVMRTNIKLGPGSLCQAHGPVRPMESLLSSEPL